MKFVIDTVELKKRQYVITAYSEKEAIDKMEDAEPVLQHIVSDSIFNIHTINEYEYKHSPDYSEGFDIVHKKPEKDHEGYQYDAFKDQDIYRDD